MYRTKPIKGPLDEVAFRLESMTSAATPEGSPEGSKGSWYRYVIAQGTNLITGVRCGDEAEVSDALREMVDRLNERRAGKTRPKTRSPSVSTSTAPSTDSSS